MKISGYTTTFNCIDMDYPFDLCIKSLLRICDEVCIADGGSTDGTFEKIKKDFPEVKIKSFPVNYSNKRWAIEADGMLKNKARSMCKGDILWHADNDEILDSRSVESAKHLCKTMLEKDCDGVIKVPFYEFWGSLEKIRGDVFDRPAVSLRKKNYSIGIPNYASNIDDDGLEYCEPFKSDSCQYIKKDGSIADLLCLNNSEIVVWHVSWLDFQRKISHYKKFWRSFHESMYNLKNEDSPENNVMFNKPWSDVNEKDILDMCDNLKNMGPRSFHNKADKWSGKTFDIDINEIPMEIKEWARTRLLK